MISFLEHWKQLAFASIAGCLALSVAMLYQERAAHAETKARYAQELASANSIKAKESERLREIEKEMVNAINTHAKAQRELSIERSARAADARAADIRLRDSAKAFAISSGSTNTNPAATADQPAACQASDLLAQLLERVANRATALAEFADESHDSASACARDYERATSLVD